MCTLTWLRREDGYELFFNRDESTRRLAAVPPCRMRRDDVDFICPIDGDAGGTWLGVNAHGLTVGILNGAGERPVPEAPRSRGLLVLSLLSARDDEEIAERVAGADLSVYRAFRLVALGPAAELLDVSWDGRALAIAHLADRDQPLCSSSLVPVAAQATRRVLWLERGAAEPAGVALHEAFHADHRPERGALSTCMHRADAETVSFTRTRVAGGRVELGYSPGAPCQGRPLEWHSMERSRLSTSAARSPGGA